MSNYQLRQFEHQSDSRLQACSRDIDQYALRAGSISIGAHQCGTNAVMVG